MNAIVFLSCASSGVAVLASTGAMVASVWKRGQSEGRQTEIMSQLASLGADHEARLRVLERGAKP